jgi:YidC/Oxa1 family membrane protein insertase
MDYDGFFGWFAQVLLSSMNGLHKLGLPYWAAIILITVTIKLLFWPLTNASTKSMKRMAALQPQMKAIQEKYKDDPVKMNRKVMEFMKEHRVNPMGGCLPVLLQMPVFFGFFLMIRSAIELRGAPFLWACDLSKPDTIFFLPFLNLPFNPLPLIMGVTMLWQARLTPVAPGMDPMQQNIMKYMPLMFLFILYNFSSGLTLYWTVQNLLSIAQMKITRAKDEPGAAAGAVARPGSKPKATLEQLLEHLGFEATVEEHNMDDGLFLDVKTDDSGRLIGRQGQTLSDLQYLLNRLLFQQDPSSPKVTVDVGGYRAQARDALVKKAKDAAEKVRRWGDVVELEPLNAFDRRIIHNVLKDDPGVETHSVEVEGTDKKAILLRPKH